MIGSSAHLPELDSMRRTMWSTVTYIRYDHLLCGIIITQCLKLFTCVIDRWWRGYGSWFSWFMEWSGSCICSLHVFPFHTICIGWARRESSTPSRHWDYNMYLYDHSIDYIVPHYKLVEYTHVRRIGRTFWAALARQAECVHPVAPSAGWCWTMILCVEVVLQVIFFFQVSHHFLLRCSIIPLVFFFFCSLKLLSTHLFWLHRWVHSNNQHCRRYAIATFHCLHWVLFV